MQAQHGNCCCCCRYRCRCLCSWCRSCPSSKQTCPIAQNECTPTKQCSAKQPARQAGLKVYCGRRAEEVMNKAPKQHLTPVLKTLRCRAIPAEPKVPLSCLGHAKARSQNSIYQNALFEKRPRNIVKRDVSHTLKGFPTCSTIELQARRLAFATSRTAVRDCNLVSSL